MESIVAMQGRLEELMPLCSCKRGQKVLYCCQNKKCDNFEKQKLYCVLCAEQLADPPHDHRNFTIATDPNKVKIDWRDTRSSISQGALNAAAWFKQHEPLCRILEHAFEGVDPQPQAFYPGMT